MQIGWIVLFVVAATPLLGGQQAKTIRLEKPDAVHPAEWIDIAGVRELRDGRVIVLDARDQAVKLADMKTGTTAMIGRKGNGPGEYRLPLQLVALPGDSSAVYDEANAGRAMVITPTGTAGGYLPGEPAGGFLRQSAQSDSLGRIYREGGGAGSAGFPIMRLDRANGRIDTIAYRTRRSAGPCWTNQRPMRGEAEARQFTRAASIGPRPLATFAQWAVAPDGRVALVCPNPYHVVFVLPNGSRVDGSGIPYVPLRVTEAEKKAWMESLPQHVAQMIVNSGGGKTVGYVKSRPPVTPQEWPEFLPPFVAGRGMNGAAFFAPDGMLWVARSVAADAPPLYDVVGPTGRLAFRVTMPPRTTIVGFGPRGIYAVRLDDDDLGHLERFRFPAMTNR